MLGGGTWSTQNKKLPGAYISFISAARANSAISDRGTIAFPMELDWGDTVTELTNAKLLSDAKKLLGHDYNSDELKDIREIMCRGTKLYIYRLNGTGVKASCTYADAKYAGTRGNALKIVIANSVDSKGGFDVSTYFDNVKVDSQTVAKASELIDNDYVTFKKGASLEVSAGTALVNGTDSEVDGEAYSKAMSVLSGYTFNAIGFKTTASEILSVIKAWTIRMRDEVGSKFQTVICGDADHEGIVSVADVNAIPWVTGAIGGCGVAESLTNTTYDGEKDLKADYTQDELEDFIDKGKFVFHKVGDEVNVLMDINSLVTYTTEKGSDFAYNQIIRVIDTIATSTASIFSTTYLGKVQNNADGRVSLKSQLVAMLNELQNIGAIENFQSDDVTVDEGNLKRAVVVNMAVTPVLAMEQLYAKVMIG